MAQDSKQPYYRLTREKGFKIRLVPFAGKTSEDITSHGYRYEYIKHQQATVKHHDCL